MKKLLIITILVIVLLALGVFLFLNKDNKNTGVDTSTDQSSTGFNPFGRGTVKQPGTGTSTQNLGSTVSTTTNNAPIPKLRLLSSTPVGGYGASTTASSTIVRWVDRGRGNIYEASDITLDIKNISNTLLPMVYGSNWNKNLTSFIAHVVDDEVIHPQYIFAELTPQKTATSTTKVATSTTASSTGTTSIARSTSSTTPFYLKGNDLPDNVVSVISSPKKDKILIFEVEGGKGVGYTASFNGKGMVKIFETALTQVNIDWPEENIIAISTNGTAYQDGYLYFVNPKTGVWKKIIGPVKGITAAVSHDGKNVFYSKSSNNSLDSYILNIATGNVTEALIGSMADKCAWGNFYQNMIYCAQPIERTRALYPDDWYKGKLSTVDKIWQINATNGETKLVADILGQADRPIDAFNMALDTKDEFLFFMNKKDLTLWSLDLVRSN